ncbi:MAG: DnaJ domain-containing protein [Bacteroidota bacterium]
MNHYEILGVTSDASPIEIKKAYRKLAKKYHPDVNPSRGSFDKIRLLNEAYEVLSDVEDRQLYDRVLQGEPATFTMEPEDPYEKHRSEYRHWKAKKEQSHLEYLIRIKAKFYKYERYFNVLFFVFAALLTFDYHAYAKQETEVIDRVIKRRDGKAEIRTSSGKRFIAGPAFYGRYVYHRPKEMDVHYSLFLALPSLIKFKKGDEFKLHMGLHVYRNVFSILILLFSAILIKHKEYSDFRLSCGMVPAFLVLFLVLFLVFDPAGW